MPLEGSIGGSMRTQKEIRENLAKLEDSLAYYLRRLRESGPESERAYIINADACSMKASVLRWVLEEE